MIAKVLVDGPSELVFDYAIPENMAAQPGCRVRIPLRNRRAAGTILRVVPPDPDASHSLRFLDALLDPEPLLTPGLLQLANFISSYYGTPLEQIIRSIVPAAVRGENTNAKKRKALELVRQPTEEELATLQKRAKRQHTLLALLQGAGKPLPLTDLGGGSVQSAAKALAEKGFIKFVDLVVRRDPDATETFLPTEPLELNDEQAQALKVITTTLEAEKKAPILLHGITGSGKTEVYLQAVQATLKAGKSVTVLVPEIALAPQTVQRFKSRFHKIVNEIAVLHSNLSQGERFDEWNRIRSGKARIVIGARSAIFAPIHNPGLIIVDEEHETAYKQENPPKYHARDLAVVRGALDNCTVLLGSATPSLETFHNVETGKYQLVKLTQRADGATLPLTRVIDMKIEARKHKGRDLILSDPLRQAITERLENGEQAILFLNRRGYSRSLQCPPCGHVVECTHCAIPLTYHRPEERLICHICGHQAIIPRVCPSCKDPAIRLQGYGTQKAEEILKKVFPQARIARLDTDTTRKKHALRDTLRDFRTKKIHLLLGTQMIAKGLDFPNVTLVGVLNADLSLHAPDFRAGERTFQLLTQVAGRAGRGDLAGEVVIQTFTPHSPSIQFARHHDYEGFAEQEMAMRRNFSYPPYTHLAVLMTRSSHERRAEFTLETLHRKLEEKADPDMILGDPLPCPLTKSHSQYRFQVLLRGPNPRRLSRLLTNLLNDTPTPEDVIVNADIDAFDLG